MEFCIARIRGRRIRASYLLRRLLPSIPSFRNRFRIEAIIILEHFWRCFTRQQQQQQFTIFTMQKGDLEDGKFLKKEDSIQTWAFCIG